MATQNHNPGRLRPPGVVGRGPGGAARGLLAAAACVCLTLPGTALAAPVHPRVAALDVTGLNHACGAAVDSEGDLYLSSAGESKVKVYDPSHNLLASIAETHEPCGLAVTTAGTLYVSEKGTGDVVRFKPGKYPFEGTPTYGSREIVDTSGKAKGISVDPYDNFLYVAEGEYVSIYNADGLYAFNEGQQVSFSEVTGGTFALEFNEEPTTAIPYGALAAEVQAALEALSSIGEGNVSVETSGSGYKVTFVGALGHADVEKLVGDASNLVGGAGKKISVEELAAGFSGHIGEGIVSEATGVASYTSTSSGVEARHVIVADAAGLAADRLELFGGTDKRTLNLNRELTGSTTPSGSFGFGAAGAYLAADPGNINLGKCEPVGEEACTAGHLFLFDAAHGMLDEFDASGQYVDSTTNSAFTNPALADGNPTAVAIDRSGGVNDGTVYVTAGAGAGAAALAFGPLPAPVRATLPEPISHLLPNALALATDSQGDVYAAAGRQVHVYRPDGTEITNAGKPLFEDSEGRINELAVDSTGKVYILEGEPSKVLTVVYYAPSAYPPAPGTTYVRQAPASISAANFPELITAMAINPGPGPGKDHLFLTGINLTREYDSAANGSTLLNAEFGKGMTPGSRRSLAVNGANGNVLISLNPPEHTIYVLNATGTRILSRINTAVSPSGVSSAALVLAVDQASGHVVAFDHQHQPREYDASGAFVAEFGNLTEGLGRDTQLAVDNSCELHQPPLDEATTPTCKEFDPAYGNVYLAFDDPNKSHPPYDVNAFGPLAYGQIPDVLTGIASGLGEGKATLNGTVDPNGFPVGQCSFAYIEASRYDQNEAESKTPFEGAEEAPCEPEAGALGSGDSPVAVDATVTLADPEAEYRFALRATNKFGESDGEARLFGAPQIEPVPPLPILYSEATLHARVSPSGLATDYRFEYLDRQSFEEQGGFEGPSTVSTAWKELAAGDAAVPIATTITGLSEGTEYAYRVVAKNEAATVAEPTQTFVTQLRLPAGNCSNGAYRVGHSADLPDCRAYELVTPPQTNGLTPHGATDELSGQSKLFNTELTPPRGEAAGDRFSYFTEGTLPGFEGNGGLDGYRAERGAGSHPAGGWQSTIFSPSLAQEGTNARGYHGIASGQLYSVWELQPASNRTEALPGSLAAGTYLRTPGGFEMLGRGSLGTDLEAVSRYVSPDGDHVIFVSKAELEPEGPVAAAIYDRAAGSSSATVLSTPPPGASEEVKEEFEGNAGGYVDANEAGTAVVFNVGGVLYVHRAGETAEVAEAPNTFAGISGNGERIFYTTVSKAESPGALYACDVETGPCAGPGAHPPLKITDAGIFALVSPDGSHAFFSSEEAIGEETNENGEEPKAGPHNLYVWDGSQTRFVGRLTDSDFAHAGFAGITGMTLADWTSALGVQTGQAGRADAPTRSTPEGGVFVFQSHARLTSYDNEGWGEIYRYDPAAEFGQRLLCVSCDPSGAPPSADALLQDLRFEAQLPGSDVIANVTDDGARVFFQSFDPLLPEDANESEDIYEWLALGTEGCTRPGGCLALISSGTGDASSYLFAMSADGHDVFFRTQDELVGSDLAGPSIYDARVDGGIPETVEESPCQGDACQGQGSEPPALPAPATIGSGEGNVVPGLPPCPKGKHRVNGRCVPVKHKHKHKQKHHKRRRAQPKQGGKR